jgi:extracellular matrix regulatory protein A
MMISVGYRNYISVNRIVAIISPDSRPTKNMINGAREQGKIVDATMGKKTKSVIISNSNHIILSANSPDTIVHRIAASGKKESLIEEVSH